MTVERKTNVLNRSESLRLSARYMGMPIVATGIDLNIIPDKIKYWSQGSKRNKEDFPMFQVDYRVTEAGLVLSKNHLLEMNIVDEREGLLRQAEEKHLLNDERLMTIRQIKLPSEQKQELESLGGKIETAIQIRMSREKDWAGNQYFHDLVYLVMTEAVGEEGFKIENFTKTLKGEGFFDDNFLVLPKEKLGLVDKALLAAGLDLTKQPGVKESYQKLFSKRKGEYGQKLLLVDGEVVLMLIDNDQRLIWGGAVVNKEGLDNFIKTQNELGKLMAAGGGSYQELITFSDGGLSQKTSDDKEEQIVQVTKVDADGKVETVFRYLSPEERFDPENFQIDERFTEMTKVMLQGLTEGNGKINNNWLMADDRIKLGPWWLFENVEQRTIEELSGEVKEAEKGQPASQNEKLMINQSEMAFIVREQIKTDKNEGNKRNELVSFTDLDLTKIIYQADEDEGGEENEEDPDTEKEEIGNDEWGGGDPSDDVNPDLPGSGGLTYKKNRQSSKGVIENERVSSIEADSTNEIETNITKISSIESIDGTKKLVNEIDFRVSSSEKREITNSQRVTRITESSKSEKGRLKEEKSTEASLLVESRGIKTIPIRDWHEFLGIIQLMAKDYPEFDLSNWLQISGIELNILVEPLLDNVKNNVDGAETALAIKKLEEFVFFADRAGVAMATLLIFASNNSEPVRVRREQVLYGQGRGLETI